MSARRPMLALLALSALAIAACADAGAGTPDPTPTLTPTPDTSLGIHTPEDMRRQADGWPDAHKLVVSDEVVVLFTEMPGSTALWVAAVLIQHIPSMSTLSLYPMSHANSYHYRSPEGRAALEAVLADDALMARIVERVSDSMKEHRPMLAGEP